jgi:hypothetical protein
MNPHHFYSCCVFPTALRTTFQALAHTWFKPHQQYYRMCSQWQISPIYSSFSYFTFLPSTNATSKPGCLPNHEAIQSL